MLKYYPSILILICSLLFPIFPAKQFRYAAIALVGAILSFALININFQAQFNYGFEYSFYLIFIIMTLLWSIFAFNQSNSLQWMSTYWLLFSALGVIIAEDWIFLLLNWEFLSLAAVIAIACRRNKAAKNSALRYGVIHILGGTILFLGISLQIIHSNQLTIATPTSNSAAYWLILLSILINCAAFPLSAWLPDSYPKASPIGMVALSIYTTKIGLFMLLKLYSGEVLLIFLGLFTAIYALIYAFYQKNLKIAASYLIISQISLIMIVVGISHNQNIAAFAAICSLLYLTLFIMVINLIDQCKNEPLINSSNNSNKLFRLEINTVKILYFLLFLSLIAMIGFPLTAGFISKKLVQNSIKDYSFALYIIVNLLFIATIWLTIHISSKLFKDIQTIKIHHKITISPIMAILLSFAIIFTIALIPSWSISTIFSLKQLALSHYNLYSLDNIINYVLLLTIALLLHNFTSKRALFTRKIHDLDVIYIKISKLIYQHLKQLESKFNTRKKIFPNKLNQMIKSSSKLLLKDSWHSSSMIIFILIVSVILISAVKNLF